MCNLDFPYPELPYPGPLTTLGILPPWAKCPPMATCPPGPLYIRVKQICLLWQDIEICLLYYDMESVYYGCQSHWHNSWNCLGCIHVTYVKMIKWILVILPYKKLDSFTIDSSLSEPGLKQLVRGGQIKHYLLLISHSKLRLDLTQDQISKKLSHQNYWHQGLLWSKDSMKKAKSLSKDFLT